MIEEKKLLEATCPECRGPLSEHQTERGPREFVCLVGHRYSARALLEAHSESQEKALWSAVVALEETVNITRAVTTEFTPEAAESLREQSAKRVKEAVLLREILQRLEPFSIE
jgi:two-component system chemotaxis response regulator CheB